MRDKIISLYILLLFVSLGFTGLFITIPVVDADDYTNPYYVVGTSILLGHQLWDADHTYMCSNQNNNPCVHVDDYPGMTTNFSAWEDNATQCTGWDAYNLGWGGGNMRTEYMDNTLLGTYGQGGLWRAPVDLEKVEILLMDNHHDVGYGTIQAMASVVNTFYSWFCINMPNCTIYTIGHLPDNSSPARRIWTRESAAWWDAFEEGKANLVYVNVTDYNLGFTTANIWQTDTWDCNPDFYNSDDIHLIPAGAVVLGELYAQYILSGGPNPPSGSYEPPVINHMGWGNYGEMPNQSVMAGQFWVNFTWNGTNGGTPYPDTYDMFFYEDLACTILNYGFLHISHNSYVEGGYVNISFTTQVIDPRTDKYYMRIRAEYE